MVNLRFTTLIRGGRRALRAEPRGADQPLILIFTRIWRRQQPIAVKDAVRAGITVCSGGIIGMGESVDDRCRMLIELSNLDPHPESVPVNALVRVEGTPLEALPPIDPLELVRMIAVARVLLPRSKVRLSAGRTDLPREAQLMCLYAGANSIFYGDKLLTTPNPGPNEDMDLLRVAGLKGEISSAAASS